MNPEPMELRTPYAVSPPRYSVSHQMVTTAFELPNHRIVQNLGVVRGIVVRSRNIFATIGAQFQTIVGGNITVWTKLCEQTRADAFDIMIQHASEVGANAVVGARYDTTEISAGVTEVLAYGTAVIVQPNESGDSYRS
ncbi:MAG TPA: YbjQ family protein [Pyrinomonadaceae bacterium]|nr:YbjQ family protein [Pyrinomonadaceae bacterium]